MAELSSDDRRLIELACTTVDEAFIGVLSTVDAQHRPRSRYMAAVRGNRELQRLYCLTGSETRKVHEIRDNPSVCWLFHDAKYQHIVRLAGKASFISTSDLAMDTWNQLVAHTDPYAEGNLREKDHFAFHVLLTELETLEVLVPQMGLTKPRTIDLDAA